MNKCDMVDDDELLELGGTYARYYEMQFGRPSEGL